MGIALMNTLIHIMNLIIPGMTRNMITGMVKTNKYNIELEWN
jgi:hypothetical protein